MIYILENIPLGTSILYITVSDCDSGENGYVTMELISTSIVQLEKKTNNTYVLKTNIHLDREEKSSYTFTLLTYDHGQPRNSIENIFQLNLIDINDCSPIFNDNLTNYTFYIDENNQENYILHTINITDFDENDQITIELKFFNHNEYKKLFQLNEKNQLIILKSLDYEQQTSYEFSIQAEDKAGHQTVLPIRIHLNDLNDNPVKFLTKFLQFKLEENQDNYTFVSQIQAYDQDKNDQIIYSIYSEDFNEVKQFFDLKSNGNLYTKISFDREQISNYKFRILANDSIHTDILTIQIDILDQNDNKPILKTSSPYCYIYNQTNFNQTIEIDLHGYDPDENDNGYITYLLKNPSSNDLILLSNGTLLIQPIFHEYTFDIYLQDNGKYSRLTSIYKNFLVLIVYNEYECRNYSLILPNKFNQQTFIYLISIILISLACFTIIILIICCCFYFRRPLLKQQTKINCLNNNNNKSTTNKMLTPSFSSSLNDDAENDTLLLSSPSPQFTAMTTVSTSTTTTNDSTRLTTFIDRHPTNKSSSLSSSSSSTYVKMSRSFEEEML